VPGAYATSEPTAERTIIIPIFGLAFFLLWAGFLLGQQLSASSKGSRLLGSVVPIIAVFMLTCSAILSFQNTYSIRTIYIDFAQRWDGADTQILSARVRGAESVTIPDMNVPTGPEGDPIDNPRYWVNQCYSLYYGMQVLGPSPDLQ
jgi:hypothetical protein